MDSAALAATASGPGVTAAAGPYDTVQTSVASGPFRLPPTTVAGRAEADTAVDRLEVVGGAWLTGPGQIVLHSSLGGLRGFDLGSSITVGTASLKVVGFADSVTDTAQAWVWPSQDDVLQGTGVKGRQMLYRFTTAETDEAIRASLDAVVAGLPADAVTGADTYLAAKVRAEATLAAMVPFVVAFAILGLALSVLIVSNVVCGAVVAGYRRIGVLKSLGYTPRQVVAVYAGQVLAAAVPAGLLGVVAGHLLSIPLLAETAEAFDVGGVPGVPIWADLVAFAGVAFAVAVAAVLPAIRAGRLSAVQAIMLGRAPRTRQGYRVRRFLAGTRRPRAVRFGLGTPFTRPARSAMTLLAVLFGATIVVLAVGLTASMGRVNSGFTRAEQIEVTVDLPRAMGPEGLEPMPPPGGAGGGPPFKAVPPEQARAAIAAQPGTVRSVGLSTNDVSLVGSSEEVAMHGYHGDASWVGYQMLSGRWYNAPDEAVVGSRMLRLTGTKVGDVVTVATRLGERWVRIVGEVFSRAGRSTMYMDQAGLAGLFRSADPNRYEIALADGADVGAYVAELSTALGQGASVQSTDEAAGSQVLAVMIGLIVLLSLILAGAAVLGVLNTVVLNTRERVHEIGVLKAIGMTPRQVRIMVVASMVVVGALGGALALPLAYLLHRQVIPVMADAAGTGLPDSVLDVFGPLELAGLGFAGVVVAVLGALLPAGWAARGRTAVALRAE